MQRTLAHSFVAGHWVDKLLPSACACTRQWLHSLSLAAHALDTSVVHFGLIVIRLCR